MGDSAVKIAEAAPELRLIMQERPEVVAIAQDAETTVVPEELQYRISFEAHDFFQLQKTLADVYFFRKTLLNYTDKYATQIVQALTPAAKAGNRLVIMDFIQPDRPVEANVRERYFRAVDLQMMLYYNCKYRTLDEWKELVSASDPAWEFERAVTPPGSALALISFIRG